MKLQATIALIAMFAAILPVKGNDFERPEGWATCASTVSAGNYALTGGGDGSLIVLRSDGADQREIIRNAVNNYDVIVFDGRDGDFELSSMISLQSLSGRTLIGVNGARLRTTFTVSKEICDLLDELDVKSLSSNPADNLGGTLSNGIYVNEQCERAIRQALIDRYGDEKEKYRFSGVFSFDNCSNIIIRNLDFEGPGSLDVGGSDLLTLNGSDHVWVDHCRFTDGLDGNLDVVNNSDFVTVTDTHFRYTSRSYNHPLSNLNSGTEITGGPQKNNVSWIRCFWDEGCMGRMPFTTLGVHHLLNCYWDCTKGTCIDAHNQSKLLIESSYFSSKVCKALAVRDDNVTFEWRGSIWQGKSSPRGNATINVPYSYDVVAVEEVPEKIRQSAGPSATFTFDKSLSASPSVVDFHRIYAGNQVESRVNISAFGGVVPSQITLTAPDGVLLSTEHGGDYVSSLTIDAADVDLIQTDVYLRALFSEAGVVESPIVASAPGVTLEIPVKAEVVALEGKPFAATLAWPLDNGKYSATEADATFPEAFSRASFSLGDKVYIHSGQKIGGSEMFTLFNPTEAISKAVDPECRIDFDIVSAPGHTFVPKVMKMNASRVATDMCYIDVEYSRDSEKPQRALTACQPPRSSSTPSYAEIVIPLDNAGVGETLHVSIYLYNMSANKQLALGNVTIEGDVYAGDSAVESIVADEEQAEVVYYDLLGRKVANPQNGRIYLMVGGAGRGKVVKW